MDVRLTFENFEGICEGCTELMERVGRPLPRHGAWFDGDVCNQNSWTCGAGYSKSETDLYCCPQQPDVNSVPYLQGRPCKLDCNPGYLWSDEDERCINCPSAPAHAEWTYGCNFKCDVGFFGSDMGKCLNCRAWRYETASSPPPNARWPEVSISCSHTDWECEAGYEKSLAATIPGCCPTALPEGGSWATPGSVKTHCGIICVAGWSWDETQMTCVGCPQFSYSSRPTSAGETYAWDSEGSCSYKCNDHFYAYPPAPARLTECVTCALLASRMQWHTPDHSRWPEQMPCQKESWDCEPGYIKNSKVCCFNSRAPVGYLDLMNDQQRGRWVADDGCEWRCNKGYFPTIPRPEDRLQTDKNCMLCKRYLQQHNIPSCYDDPKPAWCLGKVVEDMPAECVASLSLALSLRGISVEDFTAEVELVLREGIAVSVKVALDQVFVTSVTAHSSSRRAGSMVRDNVVAVGVEMRGLEPYAIDRVKLDTQQRLVPAVNARLQQNSIYASADALLAAPDVLGGASSWRCESPKVFNEMTGMCCSKRVDTTSNRQRYIWKPNGCDWTCRQGFWQMDLGAPCLSCSEYNELNRRFKPPNSYWKDDSQDCSQWACDTGYVRSSSGFSCIQLSTLQASCSALPRCAQCVQDGDCVWCSNRCSAGVMSRGQQVDDMTQPQHACPYNSDGSLGACQCEASTCSVECGHKKCSDCVKDDYCGWCGATQTCMLGSYFRPLATDCPAGSWIARGVSACGSDDSLWLIGLVCATASTLLVACVGGYVVSRVRAAARREEQRASGQSVQQIELRRQTQRFVSTFPTFKYNGKKLPGGGSGSGTGDGASAPAPCSGPPACPSGAGGEERGSNQDDEDDEPMCSICLGEFGDGDELRMLPCLHVFHVACIDQWLGLSHECPLCKRSVVNNTNSHLVASNRQFAEAQSTLFTRGALANDGVANNGIHSGARRADAPNSSAPPVPDGSNNAAARGGGRRRRVASMVQRFTRSANAEEVAARDEARRDVSIEMVSGITVLSPNTSMLPASQARASPPTWNPSDLHVWNGGNPGEREQAASTIVSQQPESHQPAPRFLPAVAGPSAPQVVEGEAAVSASGRISESDREVEMEYMGMVAELTPVSPFQYPSPDESPEDGEQEEHVPQDTWSNDARGAREGGGGTRSLRRVEPEMLQGGAHVASRRTEASREVVVGSGPSGSMMPVPHADGGGSSEERAARLVRESAQLACELAVHREERDDDDNDDDQDQGTHTHHRHQPPSPRVSFDANNFDADLPHSPSPPAAACIEATHRIEAIGGSSTGCMPTVEGLAAADLSHSASEWESDSENSSNEIGV
jgi:hypothetical protein